MSLVALIGTKSAPILHDDSISASSEYPSDDTASRYYHRTCVRKGNKYGWMATKNWRKEAPPLAGEEPPDLWIKFCLQGVTEVARIQVECLSDGHIDEVKVSHSKDGQRWSLCPQRIKCGCEPDELIQPFRARFVRLHPVCEGACPGSLQAEMWGRPVPTDFDYPSKLLQTIRNDDEFADCKVACGSAVIRCHRSVLAAVSPVWHAALRGNFREAREATISIEDADYEAVKALLHYAYTGEVVDSNCAPALLCLAHRYEIPALVGECAELLYESMTADNAVSYVSTLNTFIEHEKVALIWPRVVTKVAENREFGDVLLRSVRQRRN